MKTLKPPSQRLSFPALQETRDGRPIIYLDGPGGAQMPRCVIDEIPNYLTSGASNLFNSSFPATENTHRVVNEARDCAAAFVNAPSPQQIVLGANASSLILHFSHSICREWKPGDEIIVTQMDHLANISFWKTHAEDKGVKVNVLRIHPEDCSLDYGHLDQLISKKTKFIAFSLASNACGTLSDPQRVIKAAKEAGAMTFIDAVHYAPHFLPDVQALDCDFLVCSPHKFCGPRSGFLYGKMEHLERLQPFKVEIPKNVPEKWEVGTKNFEILAAMRAAITYLGTLGEYIDSLRERLISAYQLIVAYEKELSQEFIRRADTIKGLKIHGITDEKRLAGRTPTFAMTLQGFSPQQVVDHMAKNAPQIISVNGGNFYSPDIIKALGLNENEGLIRAGAVHYTTTEDFDRFFDALERLER